MTTKSINIIRVPAFQDNYLWLFHRQGDDRTYVVDPGDAKPIEAALTQHDLTLAGILITHHHRDHTGGIDELLERRQVPVYGPGGGSVPQVTHPLADNETLHLDQGMEFRVMAVPGHTLDHLAYFCDAENPPILFCGDTLFAGGCGRLFEGTAKQMYQSLARLRDLPDETLVYCAHEYTLANLEFAAAVDGTNTDLQERIIVEQNKRRKNLATVPSTIALEKSTNPFLRWDDPAIKSAAEAHLDRPLTAEHEVLAAIRAWKDIF